MAVQSSVTSNSRELKTRMSECPLIGGTAVVYQCYRIPVNNEKENVVVCVPGLNLWLNICLTHASYSPAKRINVWNNLDLRQRYYVQLLKNEKEVSKDIYSMI